MFSKQPETATVIPKNPELFTRFSGGPETTESSATGESLHPAEPGMGSLTLINMIGSWKMLENSTPTGIS